MALLRGREGSIGEVVSAKLALAQAEYERLRVQARRMPAMPTCACMASACISRCVMKAAVMRLSPQAGAIYARGHALHMISQALQADR